MSLNYTKLIAIGAVIALIGFITSGPIGFLIVNSLSPQRRWISSSVFVLNYSTIQDLPFYFGFLLIGGMLIIVVGHYLNFKETNNEKKFHLLLALIYTTIFAALIFFNYICQTTFVHNLALHYKPEYDSAIAMFSMSNPMSFCWANEMWGYAILGIATILMSGYYQQKNNIIRVLLITNGIVSLIGLILTVVDVSWIMTTAGLIAYLSWNGLMIVLMILIYRHTKKFEQ